MPLSFLEPKAGKGVTAVFGAVVAAALSFSASPNWGLAFLIFALMVSVGLLFTMMDGRLKEVKALHERCELRTQAILRAMFENGHKGKKKRKVDLILEQIMRGEAVSP